MKRKSLNIYVIVLSLKYPLKVLSLGKQRGVFKAKHFFSFQNKEPVVQCKEFSQYFGSLKPYT